MAPSDRMKSSQRHPSHGSDETVPVSEFKARCLEILERLRQRGQELVVTKRGEPIARVVPIRPEARPLRGMLSGHIEFLGDIVHADFGKDWEANR